MDSEDYYYQILGLEIGATPEQVKQAYRDMAKVWHPDRFVSDPRLQQIAQERLKDINVAYEKLRFVHSGTRTRPSQSQASRSDPHSRTSWESDASLAERVNLLRSYILMALADGLITDEEYQLIVKKGIELNIPQKEIQTVLADELLKSGAKSTAAPSLEINKTRFVFPNVQIDSFIADSFAISNKGGGVLTGTIEADKDWLILSHNRIDVTRHHQEIGFSLETKLVSLLRQADEAIVTVNSNGGTAILSIMVSSRRSAGSSSSLKRPLLLIALVGLVGLFLYVGLRLSSKVIKKPIPMSVSETLMKSSPWKGTVGRRPAQLEVSQKGTELIGHIVYAGVNEELSLEVNEAGKTIMMRGRSYQRQSGEGKFHLDIFNGKLAEDSKSIIGVFSNKFTKGNWLVSTASAPPDPAVETVLIVSEVGLALTDWAATKKARDIEKHMAHYAEMLDTYYKLQNVSNSRVRSDVERAFSLYSTIDIEVSNIDIVADQSGLRVTATFDHRFDCRGEEYYQGSVQHVLWLDKMDGTWLVTGEKDLKIYSVKKGKTEELETLPEIEESNGSQPAQQLTEQEIAQAHEVLLLVDAMETRLKNAWNENNDFGAVTEQDRTYAKGAENAAENIGNLLDKMPSGDYELYLRVAAEAYRDVGRIRLSAGKEGGDEMQVKIMKNYKLENSEPHLRAWRIWQIARAARNRAANQLGMPSRRFGGEK
jgi:hypothetical protein